MAKTPTKREAKADAKVADQGDKVNSLTDQELEDLKTLGYVEGSVHTIPENISPVLKAKILDDYRQNNPTAMAPTATERANDRVRERVGAEEEGANPAFKRQNEAANS